MLLGGSAVETVAVAWPCASIAMVSTIRLLSFSRIVSGHSRTNFRRSSSCGCGVLFGIGVSVGRSGPIEIAVGVGKYTIRDAQPARLAARRTRKSRRLILERMAQFPFQAKNRLRGVEEGRITGGMGTTCWTRVSGRMEITKTTRART